MTDNKKLTVKYDNSPVGRLKNALGADSVRQQFQNALKENSSLFVASLIDLYASDTYLQNCEPKAVIMEALKAATLKLPINKALGFYYIVPFKDNKSQTYVPTGIIGYKGFLQLAQRTSQYKYINADAVYEGETVDIDRLTGEIFFSGQQTSEKTIGYFAHIETINGFRKTVFWTREQIDRHAKQYSKSYHSNSGPWKKEFDSMAIKTVLRHLLTKYGVMSVDMIGAIDIDKADFKEDPMITHEVKPTNASYAPTNKPPELPPAPEPVEPLKTEQEPEKTKPSPQAKEAEESPKEPLQAGEVDELGMPIGHPFAKKSWFGTRQGSLKDKSGFVWHIHKNKDDIPAITDAAYDLMDKKYKKLYGEPLPLFVNELRGKAQPENSEPEPQQSTDDILNSEAAKTLAELSKKHPKEYALVVAGQVPESVEQINGWMSDINEKVIEARTGNPHEQQQIPENDGAPPVQDGDPGSTEGW